MGTKLLQFRFAFGNAVLRARLKSQMSQWECAKKAGVDEKLIADIESGLANPTQKQIYKICKALRMRMMFMDCDGNIL